MSKIERQLRQTIEEQDKEICLLKDQNNKLIEINDTIWSMFREQSRKLNSLEKERKGMGAVIPPFFIR